MSKRKECLAVLMRSALHLLLGRWRGLLTALGVFCMAFMLAACDSTHFEPYDYDRREKAKLELPKDSKIELEGKRFILKKEFEFPLLNK